MTRIQVAQVVDEAITLMKANNESFVQRMLAIDEAFDSRHAQSGIPTLSLRDEIRFAVFSAMVRKTA